MARLDGKIKDGTMKHEGVQDAGKLATYKHTYIHKMYSFITVKTLIYCPEESYRCMQSTLRVPI